MSNYLRNWLKDLGTTVGALFKTSVLPALVLGILVILAVTAVVKGEDGAGAHTLKQGRFESYPVDKQTAAFRTGLDGSDPLDLSNGVTIANITTFFALTNTSRQGARQNLSVSARFNTASATATVFVDFFYFDGTTYHYIGLDEPLSGGSATTLAATTAQDPDGNYPARTYVFDSYAATHALVRVTTVSAGTVDLWIGSY